MGLLLSGCESVESLCPVVDARSHSIPFLAVLLCEYPDCPVPVGFPMELNPLYSVLLPGPW